MKKPNLKLSALCIAIGSALAISQSVHAALEEVVVTARKTIENTQDVPISITNYSAEDLAKQSVQNISDIQGTTPSMSIKQGFGASSSAIVGIRGQVQTDGVITFDQSVGLYFDDVYLGRAGGSLLNMVDVERIEVLKGPQGTLYGRNTTGGALKVISKKADPSAGIEGFIKAGAGNFNLQDFSGAVNIPLVDDVLAIRLTGANVKQDGYTTTYRASRAAGNPILDQADTDDTNQESYRANIVWNISDFTALTLSYDKSTTGDYGQLNRNTANGDVQTNLTTFTRIAGLDFWEGYSDYIALSNSDVSGYSGVLDHEFSDTLSTKLVLAHRETETFFSQDSDGGVGGSIQSLSAMDQEQDSIELQFIGSALEDSLSWTAGLFWFEETGSDNTSAYSAGIGFAPYIQYLADDVKNKSQSVFGNATYDWTDDLHMQVGVRYTEDEKSMVGRNKFLTSVAGLNNTCLYTLPGTNLPASAIEGTGGNCSFPQNNDWSNVSWIVGLDYDLTEDVLIYGKVSTGYRSGGFSLRGGDAETLASFNEEEVLDYEVGIKGDYFDRQLRVNLAYFHTEYESLQLTTSKNIFPPGVPLPFPATGVSNPADATYDGVELEAKIAATDNLVIDVTASYLGRSFDDTAEALAARGGSTVVANAPYWQASAAGTYTLPVSYGEWLFRLDYSYRTDQYASGAVRQLDATSGEYTEQFGEVGLWNARVALDLDQYGLNLAIWGKNLANEEYYDTGFYRAGTRSAGSGLASGTNTLHPAAPRMYGVELTKKF